MYRADIMKCYFHHDKDAVGICSVCLRAVCKDCVGTDDPKIICKKCFDKIKKGKLKIEYPFEYPVSVGKIEKKGKKGLHERVEPRKVRAKESLMRKIFTGGKQLPVSKNIDMDVLTPVLLFGIIGGIMTGVPLLSILFVLTIPVMTLFVIVYMRAEEDFKVFVGCKKGAVAGVLMGVVSAIISLILIISLEAMFAEPIYKFLVNSFSFLDEDTLSIIISLSGADQTLSFDVILMRAGITFTLYPLLGGLFGAAFAKGLR